MLESTYYNTGVIKGLGSLIGGEFTTGETVLTSHDPANGFQPVFRQSGDVAHVNLAVTAAETSAMQWRKLSMETRWHHLESFRHELEQRKEAMADFICNEMGKVLAEARVEANAVINRFALVKTQVVAEMEHARSKSQSGESLRLSPLGVIGVIGPFNFPLHLINAYVLPSLLTGNAVVVKPSEIALGASTVYAEAAAASSLPPGVFNMVFGGGDVGAALVSAPAVRGLYFTGSYKVGKMIKAAAVEKPQLLAALELGGKNTCVVLDDASMRQAVHECAIGGYLTTGQRCTGTDRVLVQESIAPAFIEALKEVASRLVFGAPREPGSFAGPLATAAAAKQFDSLLKRGREGGAVPLLEGLSPDGGAFRGASVHLIPEGEDGIAGYTDEECFGPDLAIQIVRDEDHAAEILNASPFGFANSVFTASTERFESLYEKVHCGILNQNRSTNLASPRLPFGGVGKSGNHRPGGAYASRHSFVPMAVLQNACGPVIRHGKIAESSLPTPDLDTLEAQHLAEERSEAGRSLVDDPRPFGIHKPEDCRLPQSEYWLQRLYAADRMAKEKKPPVFDHIRSGGPWLVSIDDEPLSVMDGMSQTATLCGGFSEDSVVRGYFEGEFDGVLLSDWDTSQGGHDLLELYADTLRRHVPGLPEVTFTNSGAEANEKAIALCYANREAEHATKLLAFEGSFHGRTLASLAATYNPAKREPFAMAGVDANFVQFPVWSTPNEEQPRAPSGFYALCAAADGSGLRRDFASESSDPLLSAEALALAEVCDELQTGTYFASIIEPMQSEGGDRYATDRFFRGLRLITAKLKVRLIFDEVQTGFGLGGPFAWHTTFGLMDLRGRPASPEVVTFAKRAQIGVVMSRFSDPEPTAVHLASAVRGRIHADMASEASYSSSRLQEILEPRLTQLAAAFPSLVENPRCRGNALAFDLPTKEHQLSYIAQRFWRGTVVFGAGERTIRYRLNESMWRREIDHLFVSIRQSLAWLEAHPGKKPPAWENIESGNRNPTPSDVVFTQVPPAEAESKLQAMLDIELDVYEPARRTPPEQIREVLKHEDAVVVVAENKSGDMVGFGIGAPLEVPVDSEGPDQDPMLGMHNTLYSASVTVAEGYQKQGIGRAIKQMQLKHARGMKNADGTPRYKFVTGRNRIGKTAAMTHLNRVFGAHIVDTLRGQYADPEGQAIYYRIPIQQLVPETAGAASETSLSQGMARPLKTPPATLTKVRDEGAIFGPAVNKLTLLNYATPAHVRALEWVSALTPTHPHLYLSSGRDEAVDKAIRLLRYGHPKTVNVATFAGNYFGHTAASTRSLSDVNLHRQVGPTFDWPRLPHPALVGEQAALSALRDFLRQTSGTTVALVYELVGERTGLVLPKAFCKSLEDVREEFKVGLIAVETASAGYRSGVDAFLSQTYEHKPDTLVWWPGGQTGYVHVTSEKYIKAPMKLVSTWDGDELTLIRHHHQLRAVRRLDRAAVIEGLSAAANKLQEMGFSVQGLGMHRVVECGRQVRNIQRALRSRGVHCYAAANGNLLVTPSWDDLSPLRHLIEVAKEIGGPA